ncbi:MAG: TlpA family protein disulfide reductase [Betaproteobacteria bacterium]|nr:TlpA family protein disulfide reductase [Betaproteobacteria bacterium]
MQVKRIAAVLAIGLFWIVVAKAAGFETRAASPAPELKAHDLAGAPKTLSDYRGKVVVLNFWATWCPPCQREMPSLERLRTQMKGRSLEIVAVSSAETPEEVNAYLAKMKLGFPILLDTDSSNTRRWKVFALPTTFVLDPEGQVRHVLTGPTEWDQGEALAVVESLMSPPPPLAK